MRWRRKVMSWITVFVMILSLTYAPAPIGAAAIGIENITISELTCGGYRVTATLIAEAGVKEVLMPSWTEANGQDELKWYRASVSGNQATCYIPASEHNSESGKYITHVYLYDNQGKMGLKGTEAMLPAASAGGIGAPVIGNIMVSEVSIDGYRITAEIYAPSGVKQVLMPSWGEEDMGQDDLIWHKADVSGNVATCYIAAADHQHEQGKYITHVYLYDNAGNKVIKGVEAEVPRGTQAPDGTNPFYGNGTFSIETISVSEVSGRGFRVTARINSPNRVKEIVMPTWTEANGQDDLIWHEPTIQGRDATFFVKTSDHNNESGKYITHIYVRDVLGNQLIEGVDTTVPSSGGSTPSLDSAIQDVSLFHVTSSGYTVRAKISAPTGVKEVMMPTWTEANGQDDLIWYKASIKDDGYAEVDINVQKHKGERGKYITHIYLRDMAGKEVLKGIEAIVPQPAVTPTPSVLSISNVTVSEITQAGYRVTANVSAPAGVKEVEMPSWTEAGGQDDLIWHKASVSNGVATYYVKASDHWNQSGKYITHIYLRDQAGQEVIAGTEAVVPAASTGGSSSSGTTGGTAGSTTTGTATPPVISNVTVSERTTAGYRVTAQISAPAGISKVEMPSWTAANGQDDLVWHAASFTDTTATCYIPAANHNGESGTYSTHVYVYDKAGQKAIAGIDTTVPSSSDSGAAGGLPTGGNAGKLTLSIPFITARNSTGYTIQVTFSAPMGAQRIVAAVWTVANGKDDLVWHEMEITGERAVVRIPVSAHNNEHGMYATTVFLFDSTGEKVKQDTFVPVP